MTGDRCLLTGDERGVSEVIAYSLIIGIAALGSILVVVFGGGLLDQATSQNQQQSAELVLQEMDSRLSTLSQLDDVDSVEFTLGGATPESLHTREGGTINVTVNKNVSRSGRDCRAVVGFDTVEYETEDENKIAYQAGGVFKGGRRNGSSLVTPPAMSFRNGSLSVTAVNITGRVATDQNRAILNVDSSQEQSENASSTVLEGPCIRPNNVTVRVQSDYYRAWGAHMETEFGDTARVKTFEKNQTALAFVAQEGLPRSLDDEVNRVVNLSGADYMNNAETKWVKDASDGLPPYIQISKEDATTTLDNRYRVNIRPLSNGSFPIGNETTGSTVATSDPQTRDVMFVLDDSGSMSCFRPNQPADPYLPSNDPSDSECEYLDDYGENKTESAKTAAKAGGIAALNATDRAGIVGYDATARYPGVGDHAYLTSDFDAVNNSIDGLTAGGQTCINCGLSAALRAFSATSGQSQNQTIVLLSDGQNTASGASDSATVDAAEKAAKRGIVVHTVGFGTGADNQTLQDVADATGGKFKYTASPSEVRKFFREAVSSTVSEEQIRLTGLTTNATMEGGLAGVRPPYITGDAGQVSAYEAGGKKFPNINDPTAPSTFRHSFAVEDGERVFLGASKHECKDWAGLSAQKDGRRLYRCEKMDKSASNTENVSESNIGIYLDGYDAEANLFDSADPANYSWQPSLRQQISDFLDDTDGDGSDELNLSSNQALVIYNFSIDDEPEDRYNRLPVLYEVGISEDAVQPEDVINIQVRNVRID